MKTKRPTPRRLPSGNWNCVVMVDGERISITDEDKEICQAKAMAVQARLMEKEEKKKAITLKEAIEEYIQLKEKTLSPSTIRGYEIVKRNRFSSLMRKNIYSITRDDVQIAINNECDIASPKTIANAYGVVRPVLRHYGIDVFGVSLPKKVKPKKKYLQIEEIGPLIEAAKGDSCEVGILLALWLGMRRSEIIGLCWDCVDEENGTITVKRAVVPDKNNKMILKEYPKNDSSIRTLKCDDYIMDKISDLRTDQSDGRVFNMGPDTLRKHIHAICSSYGITDTSVHGLRHTSAAVMQKIGVSDAHGMKRGGWKEERTYKSVYGYVFDSVATKEDDKVDSFYNTQIENQKKKKKLQTKLQTGK